MEKLRNKFKNLNVPTAYTGISAIQRARRVPIEQVRKALANEPSYTLHKPKRTRFQRRQIVPLGLGLSLQCDLADFQKLANQNREYRYCLVSIDALSRRVAYIPIKSKKSDDMIVGFEQLLARLPIRPENIFVDRGLEFKAKKVSSFLEDLGIQIYYAYNKDIKSSMAERAIRTLKTRLYKYFTASRAGNWIDVLAKFEKAINASYCRSIRMRPIDVNSDNWYQLWQSLYRSVGKSESYFQEGNLVRIALWSHIFRKKYEATFSEEVFVIKRKIATNPVTFDVSDANGENVGRYYEAELSLCSKNSTLRVERILKRHTVNGVLEYLVSFIGKRTVYNRWIRADEIS